MRDPSKPSSGVVGLAHPRPTRPGRRPAVYEPLILVARVMEVLARAGVAVIVNEDNVEAVMTHATELLRCLGVVPIERVQRVEPAP